MSTAISAVSRENEIEGGRNLHAFLCGLEADPSLFEPGHLRVRLIASDELDAGFGDLDCGGLERSVDSQIRQRAEALRTRLEAANAELFQSVRSDIRGGRPYALLQLLRDATGKNESKSPLPGFGFDWRDELVSGVLGLREPDQPSCQRSPEMVPYQPTPVRHILDLIAATALGEDDLFIDLGSGLGHVPLLVSMLTGARSLGVEVQAAYVTSAQECAHDLRLSRARFMAQDAREADLSGGTVFYLYSPFNGSILTRVLSALRVESAHRQIKVCSLGPCTGAIAGETWLKTSGSPDAQRITVFESA